MNGNWNKLKESADNIGESMLALFEMLVKDGWVEIMNSMINARGINLQPQQDYQPVWAIFCCLEYILALYMIA